MNVRNSSTNLLKKLAGFVGIAGVSSLISFPVFAQHNPSASILFEVAESPPDTPTNPVRSSPRRVFRSSPSLISAADKSFTIKAAQNGMAEVQLAQLAMARTTSEAVRQFAQHMINQHTQANIELMELATLKGVTLPKDIGAENRAVMGRLSSLSGTDFDQAYMTEMVKAHTKVVSMFQMQAQQGQDRQLKAWTSEKLPALQEHLRMAREMTE
jgi:putative membrane protein